jgi:hypothetical protein
MERLLRLVRVRQINERLDEELLEQEWPGFLDQEWPGLLEQEWPELLEQEWPGLLD